jgi:hypothetical protein
MYRRWAFALLLVVFTLATLFVVPTVWASQSFDWYTGSGTIYNAKSSPDGSHVDLILEDIVKIKEDYIVIAEPFRPKDRLIVLTIPDSELRLGQVIDCSGTLTTLSSWERALQNVTVRGYASTENGDILYHPSIIKAFPDSMALEDRPDCFRFERSISGFSIRLV